jgi:hypothetical protein
VVTRVGGLEGEVGQGERHGIRIGGRDGQLEGEDAMAAGRQEVAAKPEHVGQRLLRVPAGRGLAHRRGDVQGPPRLPFAGVEVASLPHRVRVVAE